MRNFFVVTALSLTLFVFSSTVQASGKVFVGNKIPYDLSLLDQKRKKRNFDDLSGKKGIVLEFIRAVNAQPYCQKQVLELNDYRQKFTDKGYNIVTVSYDSVLSMTDFLRKNNPSITLLSDPRSKSIKAFGLLDTAPVIGTQTYGIAQPAMYIIDKKQKIQAIFQIKNYKNRPLVSEVLSKIDQLNPRRKRPYVPPMTIKDMGQDAIIPGDDFIDLPDDVLPDVLSLSDEADSGVSLSPNDYEELTLVDEEAN